MSTVIDPVPASVGNVAPLIRSGGSGSVGAGVADTDPGDGGVDGGVGGGGGGGGGGVGGGAQRRWFAGGGMHTWLATSAETNGEFFLFEDHMDGGKMTPLHTHPESAESLYVLEGEVVMHMDGVEHRLSTGAFAIAPKGVPHAFMVVSDGARLLFLHTPGLAHCEAFYLDASEPVTDGGEPLSVDFGRVRESAQANGGIVLLGPPPFDVGV